MLRGGSREAVRTEAEALMRCDRMRVAGRDLRRRPDANLLLPAASATWALPTTLAEAVTGRGETASSLQDLLECQFRWVLRHVARLRPGGAHAIPEKERLIGNVAHALAQAVFPVGAVPDPDAVRRAAAAGIDDLIDRVAAPLRLPGSPGSWPSLACAFRSRSRSSQPSCRSAVCPSSAWRWSASSRSACFPSGAAST